MSEIKNTLAVALEQAVQQQFCQLFAVLMVRPDEAAIKRFTLGLEKLTTTETTVGGLIEKLP